MDKYLTQSAIARPWRDLFNSITTKDPAPGPYYMIMKIWSFGSISPFWMRLPSVVAVASAVMIIAGLVRRLASVRTAYLTVGVLLLMPNISRYRRTVHMRSPCLAHLYTLRLIPALAIAALANRPVKICILEDHRPSSNRCGCHFAAYLSEPCSPHRLPD